MPPGGRREEGYVIATTIGRDGWEDGRLRLLQLLYPVPVPSTTVETIAEQTPYFRISPAGNQCEPTSFSNNTEAAACDFLFSIGVKKKLK